MRKLQSDKGRTIIIYDTIEDCIEAWIDSESLFIFNIDKVAYVDRDGACKEMAVPEFTESVESNDVWGWADTIDNTIHIWYAEGATDEDLIGILAHELGHLSKPIHKNRVKEQLKACNIEEVATSAFVAMKEIRNAEHA